jgi:hypothetical protein
MEFSKEISVTGPNGTYKGNITVVFDFGTDATKKTYHQIEIYVNGRLAVDPIPFKTSTAAERTAAGNLLTTVENKLTQELTTLANMAITDPVQVEMRSRGYDLVKRKLQ